MKQLPHIYNQPQFGDETEQWFTYPTLYTDMVKKFSSGSVFVEVGAHKGKSSSYMCVEIANSYKDIKFFVVDFWYSEGEADRFKIFMDNMKPLKKRFKPLHMTSIEASKKFADNSIDFVFLDAGHEYEDVVEDVKAWYPKLKWHGVMAGHDYYPDQPTWGGAYKAVHHLLDIGYLPNLSYAKDDCFYIEKK